MKRLVYIASVLLLFASCKEQLYAPELPAAESDVIPAAVEISTDRVVGVWQSSDKAYLLELTEVTDGEAVFSHWFINANTEMPDSVTNMSYSYMFSAGTIMLTPSAEAALKGANSLTAVADAAGRLLLFARNHGYTKQICTLSRSKGPVPVITDVNKTMPQAGETVTILGRNLQYVSEVYLPVADGWKQVDNPEIGSKQIRFTMPAGEFVQGSIRCRVAEDHLSVYSPAYMFARNGVFMHSFYEWGTKKADHYAGSEFEYSISDLGSLRGNAYYLSSANLPAGHSLDGSSVISPASMLTFFAQTPQPWPVVTGADDKKGHLRFSTGDRLQTVLNCYVSASDNRITAKTKCSNLAFQMDLYVYADGKPQWNTGYISFRLNKDRTGDASVANVAGWDIDHTMDFADGWQTYTIPLAAFTMTNNLTLEDLIRTLLTGNLQTIFTVMNRDLDPIHEAHAVGDFQFSIANLRLVPITTPANTEE